MCSLQTRNKIVEEFSKVGLNPVYAFFSLRKYILCAQCEHDVLRVCEKMAHNYKCGGRVTADIIDGFTLKTYFQKISL